MKSWKTERRLIAEDVEIIYFFILLDLMDCVIRGKANEDEKKTEDSCGNASDIQDRRKGPGMRIAPFQDRLRQALIIRATPNSLSCN